jgi:hypothetical protein
LQRWVQELARQQGMVVVRLQRRISFMVVAAFLDRVRDANDDPLFIVKGGVAMELRLHLRARASKDFDTVFRETFDHMLASLDLALQTPHGGFSLTRDESQPVGGTPARRINLKLAYKGRGWSTVQLEVSPTEGSAGAEMDRVPAFDIASLGLEGPAEIPCLPVRYQLAQKIHACTEAFDEGPDNARFRDLIDILLLRSLIDAEALAEVRAACADVFSVRDKHSWPPSLSVPPSWRSPYTRLADETGFGITDVEDAAAAVRAVIAEIDGATGTDTLR